MKLNKIIIFVCLLAVLSHSLFASDNEKESHKKSKLSGVSFAAGFSAECSDIKALGSMGHLSYDYAKRTSDKMMLGFYIDGGIGFLSRIHPYSKYDQFFTPFKFSAGFLMQFENSNKVPFILAIAPCTGIEFVDMDLCLPLEIRFGCLLDNNCYLTGDLNFGISLAHETVYIEPAIRFGYNFSRK